jgi:hypothetical protein
MKWRYNELVGRIPAAKMSGTSVQYYLEVKDSAGTVITKVAKPASPNVIYLESTASAQFYPDWNPDAASTNINTGGGTTKPDVGTTTNTGGGSGPIDDEDPLSRDTSEDPLAAGNNNKRVADTSGGGFGAGGGGPETPTTHGGGFMDVGSTKFTYMKWGTTAVGGALLERAQGRVGVAGRRHVPGRQLAAAVRVRRHARRLRVDRQERRDDQQGDVRHRPRGHRRRGLLLDQGPPQRRQPQGREDHRDP